MIKEVIEDLIGDLKEGLKVMKEIRHDKEEILKEQ
jgi:hypothetical protein